jgi:peroxiredoxin
MHSDFAPGRIFPDFVLPDGANIERQLSALQGGDPMLVVLIRSVSCPKDREQLASVGRVHALLGSACCKLVAITSDASHGALDVDDVTSTLSALLHDEAQQVRDVLGIAVLTDDGDERPLIPHTFLLAPGLSIRRVWNGRHPWGRPSSCELHDALCELTREMRRELQRGGAPLAAADVPCRDAASIDQTLNDMVAAYRDAGSRVPGRSMS